MKPEDSVLLGWSGAKDELQEWVEGLCVACEKWSEVVRHPLKSGSYTWADLSQSCPSCGVDTPNGAGLFRQAWGLKEVVTDET